MTDAKPDTLKADAAERETSTAEAEDTAKAEDTAEAEDSAETKDTAEAKDTAGARDKRIPGAIFPLATKPAYALAALSGVLYFVAFPGIDVWPLAFVALVPLIVALRGQPTKRAFGLGWLAGFSMTMTGFYWLIEMLKTFSGFGTPLCLLFMSILCAYQGGRVGLMGWLYGRSTQRGWPAGPVFCVAFVASELLYPLLFPWYYAATVHQVPALVQIADLGGPILVGLMLIAPNLALAELIFARFDARKPAWKLVGSLLALPLIAAVYGAVRIHQVDALVALAPKATAGVVQANMSLMAKRQDKEGGLRKHLRISHELIAKSGPLDLIVWPETAVVGALNENTAVDFYERRVIPQIGAPAVFGGVLVRQVKDARGYVLFNSALVSNAQGKVEGRFDKHYLLAFGEYLPFGETFPKLYELSPHSGRFTPGTVAKPIPFGDKHLAVFICYEDIIPAFVNSIMQSGDAQLLVNITNDAWFGDTTEPWIHLALSKFRAVEQRRFFVRSTNSGVSAIIDPVGRVVAHTRTFQEDSVAAEIAWLDGGTVYRLLGDIPWWLLSLIALLMAFVPRSRFSGAAVSTSVAKT